MKKRLLTVFVLLLLFLNSCIGLSMDIDMNRNGSGRITMEYHVSNMAESLGRLDGNERWAIIPVSRADWERTIARLDGISIVSFSSRENRTDTVYNIRLAFENKQALLNFLAPNNSHENNSNTLETIIVPPSPEIDSALLELVQQVSAGYKFSMSFKTGANSTMTLTDGTGKEISAPSSWDTVLSGSKVSLSVDVTEILRLSDGLGVKIRW